MISSEYYITSCIKCGATTWWDTSLDSEPLCQSCWDSTVDHKVKINRMKYKTNHPDTIKEQNLAYRKRIKQ